MSLISVCYPFLSLKPKVWIEGSQLHARSSVLIQILTLFSYKKYVLVDRGDKVVLVNKKRFWIWRTTKEVPFSHIQRIDYSFSAFTTDWSLLAGPMDQWEFFTVSLMLYTQKKPVKL